MSKTQIDSIVDLFTSNRSNPMAAECLDRISHGEEVHCRREEPISIEVARVTFPHRSRINTDAKGNARVEGYEFLLSSLENSTDQFWQVHSLEFLSFFFLVYTDQSCSRLFGVLKFQKIADRWSGAKKQFQR